MSVKGRLSARGRSRHTPDCPTHVSVKLLSEAIPLLVNDKLLERVFLITVLMR
jgi:hypothetical protein